MMTHLDIVGPVDQEAQRDLQLLRFQAVTRKDAQLE
jgi:hypothetical protein